MNLKDLRKYLKANRTDDKAWDIFFERIDSEAAKSPLYDAPQSFEDFEQFLENNPEVKAKLKRS